MSEHMTTEARAEADRLTLELLLDPGTRAVPYDHYLRLRDLAPVHRAGFGPLWFCTGYDACREVLRDPRTVQPSTVLPGDPDPDEDPAGADAGPGIFGNRRRRPEDPVTSRSLLRLNPPDHTRLRGLVSRGFTPRRVEGLRPAIEAMTDDLLDDLAAAGECDVLDVLGFPLPVRVIGELVGVPAEDRDDFRSLVRAGATSLEPDCTDEELAAAARAGATMQAYFRDLIAERRRAPADDLTSALVAVQEESAAEGEARLTDDEMIATLILIFAAGFETTTNLIGNGLVTLLQHPDELERLRRDPSLAPAAVEEILRYQAPVQMDARRAAEDLEVAGHHVAAGEWVMTFLGAANRDPARFEDPERFHIVERDTPVLSFATGIHYCLGASLARLEGQVVFPRLLERFGTLELLDREPRWRATFVLRGLERLPVRLAP